MCGICGFIGFEDRKLLNEMCKVLEHRGPDDSGIFIDKDVCLGHRRLSVIDLKTGKQPIHNEDESIWIVYNGEIYNYKELRKELEKKGHKFYTNTDTEVIVHAYEEFSHDCVKKFNGMFAFAIWDSNKKELFLARDHIGIKPLYYSIFENSFFFASEIKSLLKYEEFIKRIDLSSLNKFMCLSYVPQRETLFEKIYKLLPAEILLYRNGKIEIKEYWSPRELIKDNTEAYYIKKLRTLLENSVKSHLISDVPLGAYLSGGIDSSTIVGLMSKFMEEPVITFSVGFDEDVDNELRYARIIANHFNTEHYEVIVDVSCLSRLPEMIWYYDELIGDSAIVPTYIVSEEAKKKITVVLAGEGSDEIFGGYQWYRYALLGKKFSYISPKIVRKFIKRLSEHVNHHKIKKILNYLSFDENLGEYYFNTHTLLDKKARRELYSEKFYTSIENENVETVFNKFFGKNWNFMNEMLLCDIRNLLAECYLMKADKMTMAHSMEERVPFLNPEIVEFAFSLPVNLKLKHGREKYILRKSMSDIIPKSIIKRKKRGYGTPIEYWFTTEFGDITHDRLINSETIKEFFNLKKVDRIAKNCKNNRKYTRNTAVLWNLLVFDIWYEIYILGDGSKPKYKLF